MKERRWPSNRAETASNEKRAFRFFGKEDAAKGFALYIKRRCSLILEKNGTLPEGAADMLVFLYINIVWFLAGFINGVTSFDGNMFAVPLMTLVMDPKDAIIFGCIVGLGITLSITAFYHRDLPKMEFLVVCLCSLVGIPLGMALLEIAPVKAVLIGCGFILLLFLVWQAVVGRLHLTFTIPVWTVVPVGVLSGILLSSTSMGGPVLAMYAVMRGWSKEVTISVLSSMGSVSMVFLAVLQWRNGLYTPEILHNAMWAVPCTVAGVLISIPVLRRLNPRIFRRLVLAMLAVSSGMLFVRGWQA